MTQDTRKDPRAKVLTMTVRYKSATLDEFIEHHSYDVSRGGMFIKTPSPFPPGTLLKFEVKIAAEQRVMQGVGRVVWKREASEAGEGRPSGMGVKFIKIDDHSRGVIDLLVTARGDATSAYDQGADAAAASLPKASPQPNEIAAQAVGKAQRKATMLGLGARGAELPSKPDPADAFFPAGAGELDMPPPEDRTVMKQAAELLQEALREAGGSLDEVSGSQSKVRATAASPRPAAGEPSSAQRSETALSDARARADALAETMEQDEKTMLRPPSAEAIQATLKGPEVSPETAATQISQRKARSEAPASSSKSEAPRSQAPRSQPPRSRSAAIQEAAGPASDAGGGRVVMALVALVAAAGIVYFLSRPHEPPAAEPEAPAQALPAPVTPPPEPVASAPVEPAASASASAEASASAAASASGAPAVASAPPAASASVAAPVIAKRPAVVAPVVRPKAKPAEPKPAASEAVQGAASGTTTSSAAPPPTVKPAPPAKPRAPAAPAPKPGDPGGDNPY